MKALLYAPLLPAIFLALIAINWIFNPESAASSLGLIISDPVEKNTLIRDFTAFFLGTSIFCFLGFITKRPEWYFASAIIFLIALLFNVLANIFHDASFVLETFIVELILALACFLSGKYTNRVSGET